jgi:hypothetical protein
MARATPRTPEEDRRIAIHEAAHAVMAERMGMLVDIVSADPDGCGRNGYCDYQVWGAPDEPVYHRHWRRCVVAYAGAVAESVFYGGDSNSILFDRRDDMRMFKEVRQILRPCPVQWLQFCQNARAESQAGIDPGKVQFVAGHLQACRQMTGDQLRQLLATL